MQYAVIEAGGKQYKITPGMELTLDSLKEEVGTAVDFKVLLYVEDGILKIGTPYVEGISIKGTILGNLKGPKITVSKFLAKSRYRRRTGFRSRLSKVQFDQFGKQVAKVAEKKEVTIASAQETSAPKKGTSVKRVSKKA